MQPTHVFTLPSGVECEVTEFQGKHQSLLTGQKGNIDEAMDSILQDVIVRVGSVKNLELDFIKNMLTHDRNMVMLQCRQFSLEFPTQFKIPIKYKSNGISVDDEIVVEMDDVKIKPYSFQVTEYDQIVREYELTVKRFDSKIKITLMDGNAEKRISKTAKKDVSSHLDLVAHNPLYLKDKTLMRVNLDNLSLLAIEDLRRQIYEIEGKVNTSFEVEHPNSESRFGTDKFIRINLLADANFFFPSGAFS